MQQMVQGSTDSNAFEPHTQPEYVSMAQICGSSVGGAAAFPPMEKTSYSSPQSIYWQGVTDGHQEPADACDVTSGESHASASTVENEAIDDLYYYFPTEDAEESTWSF